MILDLVGETYRNGLLVAQEAVLLCWHRVRVSDIGGSLDEKWPQASGSADMNMWPWLSPLDPGWEYVGGRRGQLRRFLRDLKRLWPHEASRLQVVEILDEAVTLRQVLDEEISYLVAEARTRQISWERIGQALGCARQSAHQRYRRMVTDPRMEEDLDQQLAEVLRYARAQLTSSSNWDRRSFLNPDDAKSLLARATPGGRLRPLELRRRPRPIRRPRGGPKVGA
jgi:hypothetical protein